MSWKSIEELDKMYYDEIKKNRQKLKDSIDTNDNRNINIEANRNGHKLKEVSDIPQDSDISNETNESQEEYTKIKTYNKPIESINKPTTYSNMANNNMETLEPLIKKGNAILSERRRNIELVERSKKELEEEYQHFISISTSSSSKKERARAIDQLANYLDNEDVTNTLIMIAKKDTYYNNRAKAVSILADKINDESVKECIISKLNDSSKEVRKWAVWGLKTVVDDPNVLEALIRRLRYEESTKLVKSWIINALSAAIDNIDVIETFLLLLKRSLTRDNKELIIESLLNKLDNKDVLITISNLVLKEKNTSIKKKIIKKLKTVDDLDASFTLERLARNTKDPEIIELLKS